MALLSAFLISLLCSPIFIRFLSSGNLKQIIRADGPKSHLNKQGTPTMGGCIILIAIVVSSVLWINLASPYLWAVMVIVIGFGVLGFIDDYLKIKDKNTKGVSAKYKIFAQLLVTILAMAIFSYLYSFYEIVNINTKGQKVFSYSYLFFPFLKNVTIYLGVFSAFFVCFVIVGSSNAVNLTDGLDGLAIGPVMIAAAAMMIFCYVTGNIEISNYLNYHYLSGSGELCVFAATILGAGLGFLWYNAYPAQMFMGDVGSLPLGGALGAMAVLTRHELLWALIGGIFVLETISVIVQVVSYKLTKKRVFKMAPLHHHFELRGWPEPKVIVRFWIVAVVLALFGLLSLKLR